MPNETAEDSWSLPDLVSTEAERILGQDRDLIARLVSERKRFEKWLQLEILKALMPRYPRIQIEKPLRDGKERCDFWTDESDRKESWLELKFCVTNYCSEFTSNLSARPITNQITQIVRDIGKLNQVPESHGRTVLLIAYPLPNAEEEHPAWASHLAILGKAATRLDKAFSIAVERNSRWAKVAGYVIAI